ATTRLLAQARTAGHLTPHIRPAPTARSLVRAFFGLCTLTEALEGRAAVTARLTDWWLLTLGSLQQRPDPAGVLGRVRARSGRPGERMGAAACGE
ncbi:TetR/AcrR family transcriptional regulator, partial [Streptomyces albidoflavus]